MDLCGSSVNDAFQSQLASLAQAANLVSVSQLAFLSLSTAAPESQLWPFLPMSVCMRSVSHRFMYLTPGAQFEVLFAGVVIELLRGRDLLEEGHHWM